MRRVLPCCFRTKTTLLIQPKMFQPIKSIVPIIFAIVTLVLLPTATTALAVANSTTIVDSTRSGPEEIPPTTRYCHGPATCPFDDLSEDEIKKVFTIVATSGRFPSDIIYAIVRKQEPKKEDWLNGRAKNSREAYVALFNARTNIITEVVINLSTSTITSMKDQPKGVTPAMLNSETKQVEAIIRADPSWKAAVKRRGVNPEQTKFDVWVPGLPANKIAESIDATNKRLLRAITSYKDPNDWSYYWHPIEGLIVTVDLAAGKIFSIWDNGVITPIAPTISFLHADNKPSLLKPLSISQPQGSSISIDGFEVSWYKWKFQYGMDPMFGLQLYHVRYEADCEDRMVLYSFRLADMIVPYGADDKNWAWRNAFDIGEYGLGKTASSLEIGLELPENALTRDCVFADELGGMDLIKIPNCVGMYERDTGFLYKHTDSDTREKIGKRGRSLVVTFMTTVGNYDYMFEYIFNMDGSIKVMSRLTGIILAKGSKQAENQPNCFGPKLNLCENLIGSYLTGPPHQHFYNFRLDFDIDGQRNYVEEHNVIKLSQGGDVNNRNGGAVRVVKDILPVEGFREHSSQTHRQWAIVNPKSTNEFKTPRGYALKGQDVAFMYLDQNSDLAQKAYFASHPIWWTKYKDDEQTAAYRFPRTGPPGGLLNHVNGESTANEDVVLWYTMGITHLTRPEEWPIMTPHEVSFNLIPVNFLSRNEEMPIRDSCEVAKPDLADVKSSTSASNLQY